MSPRLLEVRDLSTRYFTSGGTVHAVDEVNFDLDAGETLGLVGESGCGKTATVLSLTRLIPPRQGRTVSGTVRLNGQDLLALPMSQMRRVRGRKIGFIPQDALSSLNPLMTVGAQIAEALRLHLRLGREAAKNRTVELLRRVGIPNPEVRVRDYPHQFSGGMRQRVGIAMAISCEPVLLIADEPTTALDLTTQAQILEMLKDLAQDLGTALILVTHDLGVAAYMCDRISVMYAGHIVESASAQEFFDHPRMPYSWNLMAASPSAEPTGDGRLRAIPGAPPNLMRVGDRCRYAPRCSYARDVCTAREPQLLYRSDPEHLARCWGTEPDGWIRS
ncbi:MAG: ABC transporter ATP-binding protein [Lautropia sp.]